MRATLMSATQQPIAGNRLMIVKAQPPPNLFGFADESKAPPWMKFAYSILGLAAGGALTYHGYKRNDGSIAWALAWGLLGGAVWPITLPIAVAQGLGQPKGG